MMGAKDYYVLHKKKWICKRKNCARLLQHLDQMHVLENSSMTKLDLNSAGL